MWMLIEWKTEKPISTFDVVRLSSVIGEKWEDIQEGKTVFVVTKNDYSAMRARVLMISDDKRRLKKEKDILEKRERELKTIVTTCMQSIRRMDLRRPHKSASDLKAGPSTSGLKYASKMKSDASTSSRESSSSTDQNQLRDILLENRELVYEYSGDRSVRERREKRKRHRRRPYMPSISHPRTCSTPLHISTLPQISPVPHLISPLTPPSVAQAQSVLMTAPIRPLCVDKSTQTEEPYPEGFEEELDKVETLVNELMESHRTMIPRFYDKAIRGTKFEPMFRQFCDEEGNFNTDLLSDGDDECNGSENEHCEESGDNDNEIDSENEENGHDVENGEDFINGENGHDEDSGEHEENGDHNTNGEGEDEDDNTQWTNGHSSENITDNSNKSSESFRKLDSHFSFYNSSDDMVPIGDGNAEVPTRLLRDMNWSTYSAATRQLLHAIFPRKVLATHSLTGRPSPAFNNRPAKERLNQDIVNDIVKTVTQNCTNVTSSMVRSVITITCTDEAKLYRKRQKLREQKELQRNSSKETTSRSISEPSSDKSHKNANNSDSSKENILPHSVQIFSADNTLANASARTSRPKYGRWVVERSSE